MVFPLQAKRQAPAVYPPPIEGRAPTAVNAVFTGLDSRQWALFMDLLREGISAVSRLQDIRSDALSTAAPCCHARLVVNDVMSVAKHLREGCFTPSHSLLQALAAGDWRADRQATGGRATAPAGGTSCPRF